jgi:hypothetical protein
MSANPERPPGEQSLMNLPGGLSVCSSIARQETLTLADLPVGARLLVRGRKDWRAATIVALSTEAVTLSVGSPKGRTYRLRRPPDSPLSFEGSIPLLGEGLWRAGLVAYDQRW